MRAGRYSKKKCAELGIGFILMLLWEFLNAHRTDLNTHRAFCKRIQNKNDN
jgi:hypothetical protein